jgi:uncharacterized membrane protein YkvA (DUF1232 family)
MVEKTKGGGPATSENIRTVKSDSSSRAAKGTTGKRRPVDTGKPRRRLTTAQKEKLEGSLKAYVKKADKYKKDPAKLGKLIEDAAEKMVHIPTGPFEEVWAYLTAMIRLIKVYVKKEYRAIPWQSMVSIIAAIVYFVSPIDLIPDFIPVVGYIDDVFVIGLVISSVKADLDRFLLWESTR